MQYTADRIGEILKNLYEERQPYLNRMRGRRHLMNLESGIKPSTDTGTWLPEAWDQSELVIRTITGDVNNVLTNYKSRIAGNEPQVIVPRLSLARGEVSRTAEKKAAEQERLMSALWHAAGGRVAQTKAAYSQSWGRTGWYLTLPRDSSWGLPDRMYFQDPSDEELEKWSLEEGDDGWVETAESWLERRNSARIENAIAGESLFTLEEFPTDMVLPRYQRSGTAKRILKYGFTIEEMPVEDFAEGSDVAKSAARLDKSFDGDIEKYALVKNKEGRIVGGTAEGGPEGSQPPVAGTNWTLARFITPDEVYWYVCESPATGDGHIVYYDRHDAGICPLIPVPAKITDQMAPGAEFDSPMESIFASTPLINQLETILSNVATWNGLGRFYIVQPDGLPLTDDEGKLVTMTQEDLIGGQAGKTYVTMGEIQQITIDATFLQSLLAMYLQRYDAQKPSEVSEGIAGASAAAWQVNQLLEASDELLREPVENHADAVTQIHQIWVRWMRMLDDEEIYMDPAPRHRETRGETEGLISFKTGDLTRAFRVKQATMSSQQLVILKQLGLEQLQAGRIDEIEFYENYALEADPIEAMIRAWAQRATDIIMLGPNEQVAPNSLLSDLTLAARGRIDAMLFAQSQNYVLATAEGIAARAGERVAAEEQIAQESTADAAGKANLTEATGQRVPGSGMGINMPSTPAARAP